MADTRRELAALQTLLADNSSGAITAQSARDVLVSESPSFLHPTSAFSSPPSTPVTGDLWLPSDGVALQRYSGSVWVPWGTVFPLTDPTAPTWTWFNQGSATITSAKGAEFLEGVASEGDQIHGRYKAVPSAPYTATALLLPRLLGDTGTGGFPNCGIFLSDTTKAIIFGLYPAGNLATTPYGAFYARKYDTASSFNAGYFSSLPAAQSGGLLWLRLKDDNTNRLFQWSADGQNWLTLNSGTITRTDFLTPTKIGFYVNSHSAIFKPGVTCVSWAEG